MRIAYDPIKVALINAETDKVIYQEQHLGDIDLVDVLNGEETWFGSQVFTLEDFIREELEIFDFEIVL